MNMLIDQLLDECLDRIRNGESLESCLEAHPQQAEVLYPLLATATGLQTASIQRSSNAAFLQGRDRMFSTVSQVFPATPVSANAFSRYSVRILTWITGKENIDMKLAVRLTIAFILVLAVIAGLGTTAVSASNALPGDALYPLKASAQHARLILTWDKDARIALEHHFQEEYRNDVRMLMQDGRQVNVRFEGTLDAIEQNLWVIGGLPVSVNPATVISGEIKLGDIVAVEAAVQKDGSILASSLALYEASVHHTNDFSQMTPEHNFMHTAELPEHRGNPKHQSPSSTPRPTQERYHHITPTLAPSITAAPMYHQDDSNCLTCDNPSSSQDDDHHPEDDNDGDHHDDHDDHH